jgi:Cu-processing system permease protein
VPLLGLLLGYDAVAGEHERGTMDLLLSFPLNPAALLLGKWAGLTLVLAAALALGLSAPMILGVSGGQAVGAWLLFGALSAWLGSIFIGIALLLSTLSRERGRLLGIALGLWLVLVVMFDLGMIALLVGTGGDVPSWLVSALFYGNPTSLYRFLGLRTLLDQQALVQTGFAAAVPAVWGLVLSLMLWTAAPLAAAGARFRRG